MNKHSRTFVVPAMAIAASLVLAACGSSQPAASSAPAGGSTASAAAAAGEHNDADIAFATGMIPHHRQAVQMADLAATRASSAEVKDLATRIKAAQTPEIATMSGWLTGWGAPVPKDTGMEGMDHPMGDGAGMMSGEDMTTLEQASGAGFDTAFLTGMTAHHRGAVAMAKVELAKGSNSEAKALAQEIVTSQSKELDEMATLIATLGG